MLVTNKPRSIRPPYHLFYSEDDFHYKCFSEDVSFALLSYLFHSFYLWLSISLPDVVSISSGHFFMERKCGSYACSSITFLGRVLSDVLTSFPSAAHESSFLQCFSDANNLSSRSSFWFRHIKKCCLNYFFPKNGGTFPWMAYLSSFHSCNNFQLYMA